MSMNHCIFSDILLKMLQMVMVGAPPQASILKGNLYPLAFSLTSVWVDMPLRLIKFPSLSDNA
jgi:hypothetical protein